jgi:hypothetical protein
MPVIPVTWEDLQFETRLGYIARTHFKKRGKKKRIKVAKIDTVKLSHTSIPKNCKKLILVQTSKFVAILLKDEK